MSPTLMSFPKPISFVSFLFFLKTILNNHFHIVYIWNSVAINCSMVHKLEATFLKQAEFHYGADRNFP